MTKTTLQTARATNAKQTQVQPTTAVFTGGTSGIGRYTIRSLAAHYGKSTQRLRLYIVGRNQRAADAVIAECRGLCPAGDFRFVRAADLSLLREVDGACDEIKEMEGGGSGGTGSPGCIDLLVMSHADFHIGGRRETSEGLDKSISLLYYSRMRFAVNLLPLLRASGRRSHVISVFGAGLENMKDWDPSDMSFRNAPRYNMSRARTHVVVMKTLFMERLAAQDAGRVAFAHVFPGVVVTPAFGNSDLPRWFRALWVVVEPVVKYTIAVSPEEIGERVLFLASRGYPPRDARSGVEEGLARLGTDGVCGSGAYACKYDGETVDVQSKYEDLRGRNVDGEVWDHTMAVFRDIEQGGAFKG